MKAQGRERDDLKIELASLPVGSNIVFHPTAIKYLADKLAAQSTKPLWSNRAKLKLTIGMLDDVGELGPLVRELIRSIALYRDDDDRLEIRIEANLVPFLQNDTAAIPKCGNGAVGSGRPLHREIHYRRGVLLLSEARR
jgi:site-specific DNA recombinase